MRVYFYCDTCGAHFWVDLSTVLAELVECDQCGETSRVSEFDPFAQMDDPFTQMEEVA